MREHRPEFTRRQLLAAGATAGLVVAGGIGTAAALSRHPATTGEILGSAARLPAPYCLPLPIPPTLSPASRDGSDRYDIVQRAADAEILPGMRTRLWTFGGSFPGPTIESRRGRSVRVRVRNELPVPTAVHLHGGRTPAASDGYPTDLILPQGWSQEPPPAPAAETDPHDMHAHGALSMTMPMHDPRADVRVGSRAYDYPLEQRATMLWYHDHRMDFTGPAVWRGLAGMLLVRDDVEDSLPLPRGDLELPLMICDRSFGADGQLRYPSLDPTLRSGPGVEPAFAAGVLGDVILVNGAPWPVHEADAARYRLRLLNASNARHYEVEAVDEEGRRLPLVQIGSDQGLLSHPVQLQTVPLAPAERYDVILDLTRARIGSRVRLRNRLGAGRTREIMAFDVVRPAHDDSRIPRVLDPDVPNWSRREATVTREFAFRAGGTAHGRGWVIGGKPFDPARTDVTTSLGSVETWRFIADVHHPVHLHLAGFRILSRGGRPPLAHDRGLKDTVSLRPGESTEVITRFDGYRGRYLFHCHNVEHEDMGMMANLEVV